MNILRLAIPVAAITLGSTATLASGQAQDGKAATDEQVVVKGQGDDEGMNKMECRKEKVLGSRLASRKRCQTKAQWQAEQAAQRQAIERVQSSRYKSN